MTEPTIGSTLAGYRLDALIARGGMGVVYRATHLALDRPVALKVIARQFAGDEGFRDRFLRESRLAARLDHPAVVPVFDAREEGGELIVAMRLVQGGDLKKRLKAGGPLPPVEAVALLGQVAGALDAAHIAGIVHRDVKPHNILLEGDRAYLTDFGLAKALGDSGVLSGASVVGTVEYMSPEQWRGERVGPAADVYSLGCVLYESLTGVVPYARRSGDAEPVMPKGLDAVIERAVAKDPAARYASAGELIEDARERQGATPAATLVLSETADRPTLGRAGSYAPIGTANSRHVGLRAWGDRLAAIPRRWLVVPALALAAFFVAAFLLFGGGGPSVSAPIEVGSPPLRLAVGTGSVWITSATDGTLSRIDPETLQVVGRPLRLGRGVSGVTFAAGSVWVSSPRRGEVLRVDPGSEQVTARIEVGGRPGAIVAGGDRVWVADDDGAGVAAINPAGERVFKRGLPPHVAPLRLAVGAGAVWVSSASTGALRRIDLSTAAPGAPIPAGRGPAGVTVGGGLVWVANSRSDRVTRVDPATHTLFGAPIAVGERPGGIDAGTESVWVANSADGTVSRIGIESGETSGGPVSVGPDPGAIAVGEEAVWVANNGDGTVTRIEP
ncbi:MAG TPA: serine/threonine-protein kinase [Solirubrobacterales bacterium]|nr:serine/threonine-protein kinase [Solirubrobacterales bacterium]